MYFNKINLLDLIIDKIIILFIFYRHIFTLILIIDKLFFIFLTIINITLNFIFLQLFYPFPLCKLYNINTHLFLLF